MDGSIATVDRRGIGAWRVLGELASTLGRPPKFATLILVLVVVAAVMAPILAPHDPIASDLRVRELPPVPFPGSDPHYWLGTDRQGRDLLSRVIWGGRVSMAAGALSVLLAASVGTALGLAAGYGGGFIEATVMRFADVSLAFPSILIALVFAVTIGPSFGVVVLVIALFFWGQHARLVRAQALSIKNRHFVSLARVAGASPYRIIRVHLLPNVVNSVVVLGTLQLGWAIVIDGALSFLGAGVPPPTPSWGGMIAAGRDFVQSAWWLSIVPGLAIMLVVLSINVLGDWLRDELDPKLRQL